MTDRWPVADLVKCVERELGKRRAVYPRLVAQDKMRQDQADEEIAKMEHVRLVLEQVGSLLRVVRDPDARAQGLAEDGDIHHELRAMHRLVPEAAQEGLF
ncbi:MAG: hypothetical protein IT580_09320 [Verrucomicrobiales bacterium]|nr:hypothetical protein [Verrucomicrobiales bacterium]